MLSTWRILYSATSGGPYDASFAQEGKSPIEIGYGSVSNAQKPSAQLTHLPLGKRVFVAIEGVCADGTSKRSVERASAPTGSPHGDVIPDLATNRDLAEPPPSLGATG